VGDAQLPARLKSALAALERKSTRHDLDNLARFNITASKPLGVSMANMRVIAKGLGHDHELALALWKTGVYEARMLATLVDEPDRVTAAQVESWCRDFDNWAIVDTACFALFDRTPHAWAKVSQWSKRRGEFQRRAAFALLWSLTVHDKAAEDAKFTRGLALIENAASDERHFVKKAVNMALRATGKRNAKLRVAAATVARRLAASGDPSARWVGKDALREIG
jgi:3-methyladenine DNA glycosylase AlkD